MSATPETLRCVGCKRPVRVLDTLATQSGECACERCADAARHRCARCNAFEVSDDATDGWGQINGKPACAECIVARDAAPCPCAHSVTLMTTGDGQRRYIACSRRGCWRGPEARTVAEALDEWHYAMPRKAVTV